MTFVPLQVFEKCLRSNGVQDRTEYYELWNRGIIPRKLMPKKPSTTYNERPITRKKKVARGVWKNGVFRYFTKAEREKRKKEYRKSEKYKEITKKISQKYRKSEKGKMTIKEGKKKYHKSKHGKKVSDDYRKTHKQIYNNSSKEYYWKNRDEILAKNRTEEHKKYQHANYLKRKKAGYFAS